MNPVALPANFLHGMETDLASVSQRTSGGEISSTSDDGPPLDGDPPPPNGPDDYGLPTIEAQPEVLTDAPRLIKSSAEFIKGFVPPDYIVDGILQRGFFYSLSGRTGSGKTAVVLLVAVSVALGRAIGTHEVSKGRVPLLRRRKSR